MLEIKGNLLELAKEGKFDIIVHGCNCFHVMGSGIARQIKEQFPEAWEADQFTGYGDIMKLGNYSSAKIENLEIINAYTQFKYGTDVPQIDYEALTLCLRKINHEHRGKSIGLPKIGAGLAGGDWNRIKDIIKRELKDTRVTLVYL